MSEADFDHPFILSIGPQRCGTSWLDRYLRQRGDICLPSHVKEIFYFDRHYSRGFSYYKSFFNAKPDHKFYMAVSTTAFDCPEAPARVFETFGPDVKLLCPLRDPVARSYSLYQHYKRYGLVRGSLQDACEVMPQILESSYYARHLNSWSRYYPIDSISFFFQEDLTRDVNGYVSSFCEQMDLSQKAVPVDLAKPFNSQTRPPSYLITTVAQFLAQCLRRCGLFSVINFAKKIGLKPFIFGKEGGGKHDFSLENYASDMQWLSEQLSGQVEKFEALTGQVTQWSRRCDLPNSSIDKKISSNI